MNRVELIGRMARDPEGRTTQSGISCCMFSLAVQRRFANAQGVREADFINCIAWRNTADYIVKYCPKGARIGIEGEIQTRTYDAQDGSKRYVTEVIVSNVDFLSMPGQNGSGAPMPTEPPMAAGESQSAQASAEKARQMGFSEVEVTDDELPF